MAPRTSFPSFNSTDAQSQSGSLSSKAPDWPRFSQQDNSATPVIIPERAPISSAASRVLTLRNRAETGLRRYQRFSYGWDGYFGEEFSGNLIQSAINLVYIASAHFIEADSAPDEITPGPASDGSIDIEIAHSRKRIIFTLYPDTDKVNIYKERDDDPIEEYPLPAKEIDLAAELSWLVM